MVVIRLARGGAKARPFFNIVVADKRTRRDGRFIERLGHFNPLLPKDNEARLKLDMEKVKAWLAKGAQPSDRVARFLDAAGLRTRAAKNNPNKGLPGDKAKERVEAAAMKAAEAIEAAEAAEVAKAEAAVAAAAAAAEAAAAPAVEEVAEVAAEEVAAEAVAEEAVAEEAAAEEAPAEENQA